MTEKEQPRNSHSDLESHEPLTYSSYLKIPELISLQKPLSTPLAHDEMLFIIIHQTYELWFKQILFEMDALIACLLREELIQSYRFLERISEILKVLVKQIDVLETMTPIEFNRFRSKLNPASGFQSVQFRELELLAGAEAEEYRRFMQLNPEWKDKIRGRMRNLNLRTAFIQLLKIKHFPIHGDTPRESILSALEIIYSKPGHEALYKLCEHLIEFDELISLWRFRHVQMVERMIGMKTGTGKSMGVPYLQQTLSKRFFPELWEVRTLMG